jgi:hypothetical protein
MASAPLTPLQAWRRDWVGQYGLPTLAQAKQRLTAVGEGVDWTQADAQAVLKIWLSRLDFNRYLGVSLKHLDLVDRVGALTAGWSMSLTGTQGATSLALRMIEADSIHDRYTHVPPPVHQNWERWCQRALKETPLDPPTLDHGLKFRQVRRLLKSEQWQVLETLCATRPQAIHEPFFDERQVPKVWATYEVTSPQWEWMLAQGLDPMRAIPGHPPFWWLASESQCKPAWNWAQQHDPVGAETYRVFRYFRNLSDTLYHELNDSHREHQLRTRLEARSDWPTLINEAGQSAIWYLAHHHPTWFVDDIPDYLRAQPQWRAATDEAGRNLALAVLSCPSFVFNDAQRAILRHLDEAGVPLAPDRSGRGVLISCPTLDVEGKRLVDLMKVHPDPALWWQGTPEQVNEALHRIAFDNTRQVNNWLLALDTVRPESPVLRGAEWVLLASQGKPFTPGRHPIAWPVALENTPVMKKALSTSHKDALGALRLTHHAAQVTPPRSRTRLRT